MSENDDGHTPIGPSNTIEIEECQPTKADFYEHQDSIEDLLAAVGSKQGNESISKPKIQQVPSMLRSEENLKQFFEPRLISFGPIHYGKAKYQEAETFKLNWAKKFVENSSESAAVLMSRIEEHIQELRSCFQCKIEFSDENLAMFLLVEGCAVLYFIDCTVKNKLSNLDLKFNQRAFVERDMFLLENQIPLRVLELLIVSERRKDWIMKIRNFICYSSFALDIKHEGKLSIEEDNETKKAPHLLGLLRESLLCSPRQKELALDVEPQKGNMQVKRKYWEEITCAGELIRRGMVFKPSERGFLNHIVFTFRYYLLGVLEIPSVTIDVSTGPMFMNLIGYEMCPDCQNDFAVTSYICFLNELIDGPGDVKALRNGGIVKNCLDSDEKVAQLFHEMAKDLVPNLQLWEGFNEPIQIYRKKFWRWAVGFFIRNCFRDPWGFLAFYATVLATAFSALQLYKASGDP